MKAKVTLKYAVTVIVEAEDEEDIIDWMYEHSPEEVYKLADGDAKEEWSEGYELVDDTIRTGIKISK